jgi:4-amino-4-deoxy-L-arabinose transferase-like glycosyltransferase
VRAGGQVTRWIKFFAVAALCIVACSRVAATHPVFSPTWDEPLHVASGWQFLAQHRYRHGQENPPLARIVEAWPVRHARPSANRGLEQAAQIYESAGSYMRGVIASRRGNLLFLILAIAATALVADHFVGGVGAVIAAATFSLLPAILAHAGLATTDMAGTASFALAIWLFCRWLEAPDWRRTIWLGIGTGLVLLTKFTVAPFFALCAISVCVAKRRFPFKRLLVAALVGLGITYAFYIYAHAAPRFGLGLLAIARLSAHGQDAFLLGKVSPSGFWDYFPVVLGVKTPIPLLILAAIGVEVTLVTKQNRVLPAWLALILVPMMLSRMDLGVRHILPIYVPLSVLAALAVVRSKAGLFAGAACGVWLVANSALAHPDYLPWMNAFAGPHPERVVVDSNLDWGQDLIRLATACRAHRIERLGVALFGTADLARLGLPPSQEVNPFIAAPGWYAISESIVMPAQARDPRAYAWLTSGTQYERVGSSIRLYFHGMAVAAAGK